MTALLLLMLLGAEPNEPDRCGKGPQIITIEYQSCDGSCNTTRCDYHKLENGNYAEGMCYRTLLACCTTHQRTEAWSDYPECGGKKL